MQKLSRKQIREGLSQVPIDTIILGTQAKDRTLTHKQKAFARKIALGETKAQAYRDTYNTKASKKVQGNAASKLSLHDGVAMEIQAYQAAIEAAKYRTPAQLREFVIHQLTLHAMNEDINPAQRIKSLELLGKVSEVAAFTERKETTIVNQSSDIKQRLLSMLSNNAIDIIPNEANQVKDSLVDEAESLLAEIKGDAMSDGADATPTHHPPAHMAYGSADGTTHTIPHTQNTLESVPCSTYTQGRESQAFDIIEDLDPTITSYSAESNIEATVIDIKVIREGEGVSENEEIGVEMDIEKVPPIGFRMK